MNLDHLNDPALSNLLMLCVRCDPEQPPPRVRGGIVSEPLRTRKRRPSISSVIRQMKRAGVEIAGFEINRDGVIKVVAGKPVGADVEITTPVDRSEWN